jgi:hypothetical protein
MDARVSNEVNYAGSGWARQRSAWHWDRPVDVSVENVVRTFGTTPALHGVSLEIESGELVALLGPSGSGKTTLLRILAGLDVPTFGRVLFDGEDALRLTVQQRNVGLVFQNYALFRNMTVLENIGFGLRVRPWARRPSRKEIRNRALELLDFVQLSGLEKRYPRSSPAASASASPSRERSPSSRACFCSTSRSARSTPRCGETCAAGSAKFTTRPDTPPCSSPTTRKRRSSLPTAWW